MFVSLTTHFTKKVSLVENKFQYILVFICSISHSDISVFPVTVFMEIFEEKSRYALQEHLHLITTPLQVIWGKQDEVILASVLGFLLPTRV